MTIMASKFLSTPSARRATAIMETMQQHYEISIHALREEGDEADDRAEQEQIISIHALREEGDRGPAGHDDHLPISIHALREEGDTITRPWPAAAFRFLSTPSARRATPSEISPKMRS